jgi:hypothetical protein
MYIEINDNTTLQDIQEKFSEYYPYLQIEFYNKGHKKYEMSDKKNVIYPGKTIGEIKKTHLSALLEIQPSYKVADVEREFQQRFGLSVQVFWNEKDTWQQTTGMDDFTLKELNEMGWNSPDESAISDYEGGS